VIFKETEKFIVRDRYQSSTLHLCQKKIYLMMQVEELKVELVHDEVNNNISLLSHNIVKKKLA